MTPTPRQLIRAHQYLYYVLARPIWSDYDYDRYCLYHHIEGGGGSDLARDYTLDEIALAEGMRANPTSFRLPRAVSRVKREDMPRDTEGDWPVA